MIKCCIFDLDGTLLNTLDDLAASCNHALALQGFPIHDVEQYRYFVGGGTNKLIERAVPQGADAQQRCAVGEAYAAHYAANYMNFTAPYEGIEALLRVLKLQNLHTCVVSNKPHAFSVELVTKIFGAKFFDIIIGASDELPKKPSPEGVLRCMRELGLSPAECVYVGDSDVDIATARNAGIPSIGAQWGFRGKEELMAAGADYIAPHPKDVAACLASI
ncbi:MAG: HAD family hydrolase [Acetanaerobacterium sp.]